MTFQKNPISEAEALAKELHNLYGFDTLVVRNPTQADIQAKIEAYRSRTYANDAQLFIFFTGHGEYIESTREGFFIPRDAKPDPCLARFGSGDSGHEPGGDFLFVLENTPAPSAPADPDQATWNSVQKQNTPDA